MTADKKIGADNLVQTILSSPLRKFGKTSEVITAHVRGIMDLPTINGSHPAKTRDFLEKLVTHVQATETMGKLRTIIGYMRLLLDRLPSTRSDLVRDDVNWANWEFLHRLKPLCCGQKETQFLITGRSTQYNESSTGHFKLGRNSGSRRAVCIATMKCIYP